MQRIRFMKPKLFSLEEWKKHGHDKKKTQKIHYGKCLNECVHLKLDVVILFCVIHLYTS